MQNQEMCLNSLNSEEEIDKSIFSENDLSDSFNKAKEDNNSKTDEKKIDRNYILDSIRKNAPISIFKLKRELGIGYSTLWDVLDRFEHANLIRLISIINQENREEKIIYILRGGRK